MRRAGLALVLVTVALSATPAAADSRHCSVTGDVCYGAFGIGSHVRLRVTNVGQSPTTLAPWGPTVMAPGGVEIIPVPPHSPHPGDPKNARHPGDFAPNQRWSRTCSTSADSSRCSIVVTL